MKDNDEQHTEFPFKYAMHHPSLYNKIYTTPYQKVKRLLTYPILLLTAPLRILIIITLFLINSMIAKGLNANTLQTNPLPPFRKNVFRISSAFWSWIMLLFYGVHPSVKQRRDMSKPQAAIYIMKHVCALDILVNNVVGTDAFVTKADKINNPLTGPPAYASRSLAITQNSNIVQRLVDRYHSPVKWPSITIYPEGTTSSQFCLLRFRTGAFRIGVPVQPLVTRFRSYCPEWLWQSPLEHFLDCCTNSVMSNIDCWYLEQMNIKEGETVREFADRVGYAMSQASGVQYVPYDHNDIYYFQGTGDINKCTPEYIRDYGWMGTLKDYKQMCKKAGVDWKFEWPKETFELK
ncbi:Lysophospholipid_acyltransferase [Hexamita inflata]|uniref:Lysophospholipid acyltransferase n=1 Tax=Hexamita inflata TaxID=28002 RepID=A0AA86R6I8_9EUKA|nr:Lysophospholipid acyltransferase [Hexamita inflata]